MTVFPDSAASGYDEHCIARVPGYELAQELMASLAVTLIPDNSLILISGCGTGNDIRSLASVNSSWKFTAIEPSAGMLMKAKQKISEAGWLDRVSFVNECMENAPEGLHFGAVSMLVCHFIKGDEAKHEYLKALSDRMESGAPLFILDYTFDSLESVFNGAYVDWMRRQGLNDQESKAVIGRIRKSWGPVSSEQFEALLHASGFRDSYLFCRAYNYQALLTLKK